MEQLTWLAINAYHEARGEPFEGIVAVCHVVLNRVAKRKKSIKDVVLQPMQFSWANGGARPPIKDYDAFVKCMLASALALDNRNNGETFKGADHYFADTIPEPKWAKNMKKIEKIGHHTFYVS